MSRVTISKSIGAPVEKVWSIISDVEGLPEREEAVEKIEFLTGQRTGPGTRFRETRSMGSRSVDTELEITESVPNESIRFISDTGGTVWDTVYRCHPEGQATRLEIDMDARPQKLRARLMLFLIMPMVRKGMSKHLDALKTYCESPDSAG